MIDRRDENRGDEEFCRISLYLSFLIREWFWRNQKEIDDGFEHWLSQFSCARNLIRSMLRLLFSIIIIESNSSSKMNQRLKIKKQSSFIKIILLFYFFFLFNWLNQSNWLFDIRLYRRSKCGCCCWCLTAAQSVRMVCNRITFHLEKVVRLEQINQSDRSTQTVSEQNNPDVLLRFFFLWLNLNQRISESIQWHSLIALWIGVSVCTDHH